MRRASAICLFAIVALSATGVQAQEAGEQKPEQDESAVLAQGEPEAPQAAPVDVVIVGKRRARPLDTSTVTDLDGEGIRDSTRPSTFEAIAEETPGLYVTSRGVGFHGVASGSSGGLHLRGLGGSPNTQILVVEDGVPDYQGLFGHPIPDAYSPFLIDRVRVVRGGDSVLYGTNALGGVIAIENRRRDQPGWELQNDFAYGSFNTMREQVAALARDGDWDATGAFSALRSDGHRVGAGGMNAVTHLSARWHALPATRLTLTHKRFHGTGADPGPVTHPTPDHWYDVERSSTSLQFVMLRKGVLVRAVQYANLGTHRLYDGFLSNDRTAGAYAQAELDVEEGVRMLVGVAGDSVGGTVENRLTMAKENVHGLTNVAGYAQVTWQPVNFLELVAGGRTVLSTEYGAVPVYKAGVRVEPWRKVVLQSRVSRSFRQPTLRERYLPYPTANPDLRPEYATTWDGGVTIEAGRLRVEAVAFTTHATDLIRYFGAFPTAEVVNIDSYDVWGLEGSVALAEVGPLSARLNGSWQDVGRYTKQNPSHQVGFAVAAKHGAGHGELTEELSGAWVGGLYQNNYTRDPIDDVFFVDAAIRWARALPERGLTLEPYLLARNVFDFEYAYIEGYRMPGFHMLGGLKVTM
jgi:outer membrane receptor protein involved in Fe transport